MNHYHFTFKHLEQQKDFMRVIDTLIVVHADTKEEAERILERAMVLDCGHVDVHCTEVIDDEEYNRRLDVTDQLFSKIVSKAEEIAKDLESRHTSYLRN